MRSMLRTVLVSHSLGKRGGGSLCSLTVGGGAHAALCLQHWQVWSGDPGEAEDPCPEEVMRGCPEGFLQTDGLCGPLRASTALLCHAGRN